ncbi:MAG TPA: site-2 protease family protein [Terriglobia bacterium]|nr:site-2 protease family protein [Terriglobia bacterium]
MDFATVEIIFQIIAFLFAISVHESAHAWSAYRFGDDTASLLGRISLNPIRHIDPIGTILLPLLAALTHVPLLGWAKPTPVNLLRLRNRFRDNALIAAAGPTSNFLVAGIAVLLLLLLRSVSGEASQALVSLVGFGRLEIGPSVMTPLVLLLYSLMVVNVILGIFNLFPIPPLDGSHVLEALLPEGMRETYASIGSYGTLILLLILWQTDLFGRMIYPALNFCNSLLVPRFL